MSNKVQQVYKLQQDQNSRILNDNISNNDNTTVLSVTPSICIENKLKKSDAKSGEIIHTDLNHSKDGCSTFNVGAVNVIHDINLQKGFENVTGMDDSLNLQTNMFDQKQNIFETVVTTNVLHMLFGEKKLKKKQHGCNFNIESNSVVSMTPMSF